MFCCKCGTQLPEDALFCQKCGTKVVQKNADQQPANLPEEKTYGDNIKPYYREQFDKIAAGQKPDFNWAALFLNGWMQLYNGCTGIFCKTFLPLLIASFTVSLVSVLGALHFNPVLIGITTFLSVVLSIVGIALSIINGLKFNEWFYRDVVSNPGKQRSKKGFWILLVSEVVAAVMILLLPSIFSPSYDDLVSDDSFGTVTGTEASNVDTDSVNSWDAAGELVEQWLDTHPIGYETRLKALDNAIIEDRYPFHLIMEDDTSEVGESLVCVIYVYTDGEITACAEVTDENGEWGLSDEYPIDQWYDEIWMSALDIWGIEEEYYEEIPQFDRSYYFENAVSVNDFLRYPDSNSPCYFERYVVDSVPEERVYICKNDEGNSWIVIDDRGWSSSANALPGDMVTVYGKYSDIVEVTFTDGSINNQVPMVYADKLINNSILPEDQEDFFNQVIESMNSSDTVYGSGSEYYGDCNARLAVGVDYSCWDNQENIFLDVEVTSESYGYRINPVDGYYISFILDYDKEAVDPYQNGAIKDEDLTIDPHSKSGYNIPLYANGTITNIEIAGTNGYKSYVDLMRGTVKITFHIDRFEAYQ